MKSTKLPKVGDSVKHEPTGHQFVISRRTKNRQNGLVEVWDKETPYPASECVLNTISDASKEILPGTPVLDTRSGHHATAKQLEGNLCQIEGDCICGWVPIEFLRVVSEVPATEDKPLDETDLFTIHSMIDQMIQADDFAEMDFLETLTKEQKGQLWLTLSEGQRTALKTAKLARVS